MTRASRAEVLANRELWNIWTRLHRQSAWYDLDGFRAGGSTLTELERDEVGAVAGKSLLHLQCHFGLDTLSWARAGATVTGVDFSPEAVDTARRLATELDIDARFVCADIETVGDLGRTFDIVYTSYGVLPWLPDLGRWAKLIARHLAPGGFFYIAEFHPLFWMFDEQGRGLLHSYFHDDRATALTTTATYAGLAHDAQPSYEWAHSLSDIIGSLIAAGLKIDSFRELPYCLHRCYDFLVESEPGRYVMRDYPGRVPLLFSLKASAAA